ncbi:hypothetical protein ACKWTF_001308 [Chironomus riparius]
MKGLQYLSIILSCCGLSLSAPTCDYKMIEDKYVCLMSDSASEGKIIGSHNETYGDAHVYRVTTTDEANKSLIGKVISLYRNLTIFQIPKGNIEAIIEDDFVNCTANLVELQICNGDLNTIPADVFKKCENLKSIDLTGNKLTIITKESLPNIINKLILSKNQIKIDMSNIFEVGNNLDALTYFDLSGNSIETLIDSILPSQRLIHLDLSNNKINELPGAYFDNNKNLEVLNLQDNQIASISHTIIKELTKLKELRIGSNNISTIDAKAFQDNEIIEYLDMSSNPIETLNANLLKNLTTLKALNLFDIKITNTSLEDLRTTFESLINLEKLNISKNIIGPIDGLFTKNEKLSVLGISSMSLTELEKDIFSALTKLESLNFDDNEIVDLPENIFEKLTEMKNFSAKKNKINKLKASTFEKMTNLLELDFTGNEIDAIESTFFDTLNKLKVVRFSGGNKCFNSDFEDFVLDEATRVKFYKCFENYNSARTVVISNVLLAFVIIFKFI